MIKEAYVSFEVAKLLREKGFDGDSGDCECHMFYCEYTEERIMPICEIGFIPDNETVFFAPTHQMAMKWLRTKGIYIYIQPTKYVGGALYGFQAIIEDGRNSAWKKSIHHEDNYEDAVEAALKYCLEKLI